MIREAVNRAETYAFGSISNVQAELKEVMREIAEDRGEINRRRLGKWIARHQGRIVDGLRFEKASGTTSAEKWVAKSVKSVLAVSDGQGSESGDGSWPHDESVLDAQHIEPTASTAPLG